MQRDVDRVEELYVAFRGRDPKALLEVVAPEVEIRQSPELPWGGVYHGPEGVRQFLGKLADHLEHRFELEQFIDAGQQVVATGRSVGKARATQLEFDIPFVHIWTVEAGQITRFEAYLDNPTLLAALGL